MPSHRTPPSVSVSVYTDIFLRAGPQIPLLRIGQPFPDRFPFPSPSFRPGEIHFPPRLPTPARAILRSTLFLGRPEPPVFVEYSQFNFLAFYARLTYDRLILLVAVVEKFRETTTLGKFLLADGYFVLFPAIVPFLEYRIRSDEFGPLEIYFLRIFFFEIYAVNGIIKNTDLKMDQF